MKVMILVSGATLLLLQLSAAVILVNPDDRLGRTFEGIGAISGGGATSKLLPNYDEKYLSEILDYLFKPQFAASLNALKVEIGGDSQSTEGTEASHMHTAEDIDCTRGYEAWLVRKARAVNPMLEIHGLPWSFPGWLGANPYEDCNRTANYVTRWILCMEQVTGVRVSSVGLWNEHPYNVKYIKVLRKTLDGAGYKDVKIIANDDNWKIAEEVFRDKELRGAIYAIGAHYPGTRSTDRAMDLGIPLWSSEDHSTFSNEAGSGCLARILNQNYVNGLMTKTLAWNLVAAYSDQLPFPRCSLMTANEPWSGHYEVSGSVWTTAHTTHFAEPGWSYLGHGSGVGLLPAGGSFVSLVSPLKDHLTLVLETMSYNHSKCIRPIIPSFEVKPQNVTFRILGKSFQNLRTLHVFRTQLKFEKGENSNYFVYFGEKKLIEGKINLELGVDEVYTLSTKNSTKGLHPVPPISKTLNLPYTDDFQVRKAGIREPEYLTPQVGYFELVPDGSNPANRTVLQQMARVKPIDWCAVGSNPVALMGYGDGWKNMHVKATVMMPSVHKTDAVFVAARITRGGCDVRLTNGIFGWLDFKHQQYEVTQDLARVKFLASGYVKLEHDKWYALDLRLKNLTAKLYLDNKLLTIVNDLPVQADGFAGLGCGGFGHARYANFSLTNDDQCAD